MILFFEYFQHKLSFMSCILACLEDDNLDFKLEKNNIASFKVNKLNL